MNFGAKYKDFDEAGREVGLPGTILFGFPQVSSTTIGVEKPSITRNIMGGYHEHVWLDHVGIVLFGLPSVKHYKTYGHQPFVRRNSRWFAPRMSTRKTGDRQMVWENDLLGGFKYFFIFHFIYGMSSFPLTNSYFSEGLTPPTSDFCTNKNISRKKNKPSIRLHKPFTSINPLKTNGWWFGTCFSFFPSKIGFFKW